MKIGVLVGREATFPPVLINEINSRNAGVTAEYIKLGGIKMNEPCEYRLIIDRISHEIPFYRAFLKAAVLQGTIVVNNPFWWTADDKFFNYCIADKIGIAVPKTILLPQKSYKQGVVDESLRNLEYPIDWKAILDYIGLPCFMKPYDGGGWRGVSKIDTYEEFMQKYDESGTDVMCLQEYIAFDHYVRTYTIGKKDVWPMPYDPIFHRYLVVPDYLDAETDERCRRDAIKICEVLGYDINTVEFAIKDGVPYAIDYMNPAPDADWWSVGSVYFDWLVKKVADLAIDQALNGEPTLAQHRWNDLLHHEIAPKAASNPVAAIPIVGPIIAAAGEAIAGATKVVQEITGIGVEAHDEATGDQPAASPEE